ncbi:PREDICTED: uncharacterized protein LOC106910873 isoform X1 [Poecilia mexicana]|uniref:uncharacterized protein LOC106910873 isoform X1 n=2 Tax=Poecilia mexicana TaxID=48701 RepID=UPI00072DC462|nr:PREDICTED: uncharacterized protein LOC106910873 isoform X1 [Poecilia mexicana]
MLGVGVKLFLFQPQTGNIISVFRSAAEKSLSVQQLIDGQEMLVLVLVLVVLQFEGTREEELHLYHRERENVVLPCDILSFLSSCSNVDWLYYSNTSSSHSFEVENGKVVDVSPRASRLNMDSSCSLTINNIDRVDVGRYACRSRSDPSSDGRVLLNVLTISPSPPDAVLAKDGEITLRCSLWRYSGSNSCPDKSLLWLDETGSELTGEGDGYKSGGQFGCVSFLTVNLQSSRRFTCQFVEGNEVKVEAHYQHEAAPADNTTIIIIGSVIGVLLLVVLAAVFTKLRKTRNREDHRISSDQDSACGNHHYDELQSNLTYATVNLPEASQKVKLGKDTVTYSTVRTKEKTEAD